MAEISPWHYVTRQLDLLLDKFSGLRPGYSSASMSESRTTDSIRLIVTTHFVLELLQAS